MVEPSGASARCKGVRCKDTEERWRCERGRPLQHRATEVKLKKGDVVRKRTGAEEGLGAGLGGERLGVVAEEGC